MASLAILLPLLQHSFINSTDVTDEIDLIKWFVSADQRDQTLQIMSLHIKPFLLCCSPLTPE